VRAQGAAPITLSKRDQQVLAPGLDLAHAHADQPGKVRHAAQQRSGPSTRLEHRLADKHATQANGDPKEGVAFRHEADGSRADVGQRQRVRAIRAGILRAPPRGTRSRPPRPALKHVAGTAQRTMKIGIDLGTANILVYVKGKGVVLNEPSVVAIRDDDNRLVAVGEEAREMIGRTPGNVRAIRPMRDGVIADYLITEAMLKYVINKVSRVRIFKPDVMISVPSGVTSVEKRAVRDAALKAGAREASLIEEPLAAAIGANVPISGPSGNMIIDIGGGTTEIAVIALGGIVVSDSVRVAGNRFDEAIANYIRRKYNLMIGDRTAEEVKIQIGSALPLDEPLTMEVKGRDLIAGLPRTIPITSSEITEAIEQPLQQIVSAVRNVLEQTPPELSSDIIDKGMVMSGGGSLLRNLDTLLTQVTGIPCHVAENALNSVAVGTGLALEQYTTFRKSLVSSA